ncbi:MAG TPA: alpha/beta fold hydrolase [Candidatus Corynebacterium avicola]|uniref:Alpha/beta fold hydrolase n=1 Tax=Candidatus Corynebacterium avicola TaxID=2838527 RepID=A0A9D1RMN4_9CORY|nr:alpha/beta fold hydrolase [Candidatus Corynebacterium avicola]
MSLFRRFAESAPASAGRPAVGRRARTALPPAFQGPLDVPLSKIVSQRAGLADRDARPAGADADLAAENPGPAPDLSPSRPVPVVLVHGTLDNAISSWHSLAPLLSNAGFSVFTVNVGRVPSNELAGGLGPVADSAAELAARVEQVRTFTGSEVVDLVGHSQGGVVAHEFIRHQGGAEVVRTVVGLGVPNGAVSPTGAKILRTLIGGKVPALDDLLPGSDFQRRLAETGVVDPTVNYTMIGTRFDEAVLPHSSLYLPETSGTEGTDNSITNVRLQDRHRLDAADHFALPYDPCALVEVVRALDPSVAEDPDWDIPTTLVLPYNGGAVAAFARPKTSQATDAGV